MNILSKLWKGITKIGSSIGKFLGFIEESKAEISKNLETPGRKKVDQGDVKLLKNSKDTEDWKLFLERITEALDGLQVKRSGTYPAGKLRIREDELKRLKAIKVKLSPDEQKFLIELHGKINQGSSTESEEDEEKGSAKSTYVMTEDELLQVHKIFGTKDEKGATDSMKKLKLSSEYKINKSFFEDGKIGPITQEDIANAKIDIDKRLHDLSVILKDLESNKDVPKTVFELYKSRIVHLQKTLEMRKIAVVLEGQKGGFVVDNDTIAKLNKEVITMNQELHGGKSVSENPEERNLCIQELYEYFERNKSKLESDSHRDQFKKFLDEMSAKYNYKPIPLPLNKELDGFIAIKNSFGKIKPFNFVEFEKVFIKAGFIDDKIKNIEKKEIQSFVTEGMKAMRKNKSTLDPDDLVTMKKYLGNVIRKYDLKEYTERQYVVDNEETLTAEQLKGVIDSTMGLYNDYSLRNFGVGVKKRDTIIDKNKKTMSVNSSAQKISLPTKSRSRDAGIVVGVGHELEKHRLSGVNTTKFLGKSFKGEGYLDFEEGMAKVHEGFVSGKVESLDDLKNLLEKPGIGLLGTFVCENYARDEAVSIMGLYSLMGKGVTNPEELVDRRKSLVASDLPGSNIKDAVYYRGQKKVIELLTKDGTLEGAITQFKNMTMKLGSQDLEKVDQLKKELDIKEGGLTLPVFISKIIFDKLIKGKGSAKTTSNLLDMKTPKFSFKEKRELVKIIQQSRAGDQRLKLNPNSSEPE